MKSENVFMVSRPTSKECEVLNKRTNNVLNQYREQIVDVQLGCYVPEGEKRKENSWSHVLIKFHPNITQEMLLTFVVTMKSDDYEGMYEFPGGPADFHCFWFD